MADHDAGMEPIVTGKASDKIRRLGVLGGLAITLATVAWYEARSARSRPAGRADPAESDRATGPRGEAARGDDPGRAAALPGSGAPESVVETGVARFDRAKADRMREQIRALLLERPAAAPVPRGNDVGAGPDATTAFVFPTMPTLARDGATTSQPDPEYIRKRVQEDLFPLARECYANLRTKNPAAAGRVALSFSILGDRKVGGVVDHVTLTDDTTLDDAELQTCMRESMMSVSFDAPPDDGEVTVVYPIDFAPDAPDAE